MPLVTFVSLIIISPHECTLPRLTGCALADSRGRPQIMPIHADPADAFILFAARQIGPDLINAEKTWGNRGVPQ